MIDLDALEVACADGEKWLHDWYDGGSAPDPPTVAALVRAVRAAQVVADPRNAVAVFAAGYMGELQRALKPFESGDS